MRNHAKRLADEWRGAGLSVDLVEYLGTATEPGGYAMTARSSNSVMSCRCQCWLARTWLWRRRPLWTVSVTVRAAAAPEADPGLAPPARPAGVAAGWDHERVWATVQDWIDQAGPLPATLDEALAALA